MDKTQELRVYQKLEQIVELLRAIEQHTRPKEVDIRMGDLGALVTTGCTCGLEDRCSLCEGE